MYLQFRTKRNTNGNCYYLTIDTRSGAQTPLITIVIMSWVIT